jgi:hypothetical protein
MERINETPSNNPDFGQHAAGRNSCTLAGGWYLMWPPMGTGHYRDSPNGIAFELHAPLSKWEVVLPTEDLESCNWWRDQNWRVGDMQEHQVTLLNPHADDPWMASVALAWMSEQSVASDDPRLAR